MRKFLLILNFWVIAWLQIIHAQDFPSLLVPTPFIQGVNVITGQAEEQLLPYRHYEFYQEGWNECAGESLLIEKDHFCIGKVKSVHVGLPGYDLAKIDFAYEPGATLVYHKSERQDVYRYNHARLLEAVEHYQKDSNHSFSLYRREKLFWQKAQPIPYLVSRVLEDEKGQAVLCCCFFYNEQGQLVQEMLAGNLSGHAQAPLQIGPEGYPLQNGVETYSKMFCYSQEDPSLLVTQKEDNGWVTSYHYDPFTKQCIAQLKRCSTGLLSRHFYLYDSKGLLEQTIVDDGQGETVEDVTGVTQRQIIPSTFNPQLSLLGQSLNINHLDQDAQLDRLQLGQSCHGASEVGSVARPCQYDAQSPFHLQHASEQIATFDPYGNETTYFYDAFGRLISTQFPMVLDAWDQPYRPVITQRYNICDQLIEVTDPKGGKTSIRYNIRGKPAEILYPDGSKEVLTYFLDGALQAKTLRDGITFSFVRDEGCRIISSEKRSATGQLLQRLHYTYQGERVQTVTDGHTFTMRMVYDEAGNQIASIYETTEGTRRLEWGDACGQQIEEGLVQDLPGTFPTEMHQEWRDPFDSPSHFIFSQLSVTQNRLGQYVKQEEKIDRAGIRHLLTYDALERLESLEKYHPMGMKLADIVFRYDAQGNKVLEKHNVLFKGEVMRTFTILWDYDACDRLLAIKEESSQHHKVTRYVYNDQGQLSQVIKPDGILLLYTYDEEGQLKRFEASDHSFAYHYDYDHLQRLYTIDDLRHDFKQIRRYNAFHELMEDQVAPGIKVCHHYDAWGRHLGMTLPDDSRIIYHYQENFLAAVERLNSRQESQYRHTYRYGKGGQLEASQLIDELGTVDYQYHENGSIRQIDSPWWKEKIDREDFDFDGRPLAIQTQDQRGTHVAHFEYGEDGQLIKEEGYHYTYDSLFNRLGENEQKWQVNTLNQLICTPSASYRYDLNGRLIEKNANHEKVLYFYDALDRLTRVEYPRQKALTYVYDAFDRRIMRQSWAWQERDNHWSLLSSERFIYDGFKEIGKVNAEGEVIELRILGKGQGAERGAAIALELQGKVFAPLHDHSGSVRCLIALQTRSVVESYDYSAYGKEKIWDAAGNPLAASQVGNPWRFNSKRIDPITELVFFGKRDYDRSMGRWITPDPLFFCDTPNLYAFTKNDPLNYHDHYGLFSVSQIWDHLSDAFFRCFHYLKISAHHTRIKLNAELKLPAPIGNALEKLGKAILGESTYLLMGPHFEETHVSCYGQREISDKVRVTFINGILNSKNTMLQTLEVLSESHGGVKVHYVFSPTEGWTWDISRAVLIRTAFAFGLRSRHAHLLAQMWRQLIQEMGGVEGGGTIVHYAHSLGGSETDRARELLTPEEQKMVRVITFGSATLIRNVGFQSVLNIISINDGVSSFFLEPLGHARNYFDPDTNIRFYGAFWGFPYWPTDHLLNGPTYGPIVRELGAKFLAEFSPI